MMRRTKKIATVLISSLVVMAACIEPYFPKGVTEATSLLVIDGFLNASDGSASVTLTHAIPLSENIPFPAEKGANVTIRSADGESVFHLAETSDGVYKADNLNCNPTSAYSLHIETSNGKSYTSDNIQLRRSPQLDSISWRGDNQGGGSLKGIQFYVNGHDPNNQTTYYRYLFTQTWEYRATFVSDWKKTGGMPAFRDPITEQVYTCWNSTISTSVLVVSTKNLDSDVVSMYPINFIPKGSRMLSRIYSINVQQRATSAEEFAYWEMIRKTTESLGGLFDPLPSQVVGNVHNDNDTQEQVLGYFSGGYVQEKRIFVKFLDLPDDLQRVTPYDFTCEARIIPYNQPELAGNDDFLTTVGIPPTGWLVAPPLCSDCRQFGGENIKPSYWPQ